MDNEAQNIWRATILKRMMGGVIPVLFLFQTPFIPNPTLASVVCGFVVIYVLILVFSEALVFLRRAPSRRDAALSFAILGIYLVALVTSFAGIYYQFGIVHEGELVRGQWLESIYFSVVTWTTLGYGDFQPSPPIRLVAAIEALLGYIFMGLLLGGILILATKPKRFT